MSIESTIEIFQNIGGQFITPPDQLTQKISQIRAFVFDWDGVFNDGTKTEQGSSPFSEIDSMGINLLRFGWWHHHRQQMPVIAIISGEKNSLSFRLTNREHYDAGYFKIKHKIEALEHLMKAHQLEAHQVAFFFDDALDLSIAERCGVRILTRHKGNPMFRQYVINNHLVDYVTGSRGGHHAVREGCELLLALTQIYDQTIALRQQYRPDYETFFEKRQTIESHFFTLVNNHFEEQKDLIT
jgi:3-deoxy-D-manno-octulosonate 8-phosphate phosphatase (KDO 8-P phosphatase)